MPRGDFARNLEFMQDSVVEMGSMVEKALFKSVDCLKRRDIDGSQEVVRDDDVIDEKQQSVEELCIELIALEAPMAGDLRVIVSALLIVNELERMGDYAEGIGKISISMGDLPPLKPLIDIPIATPTILASASCELKQRLSPYILLKSLVALKTPPFSPATSSPKTYILGFFFISSFKA